VATGSSRIAIAPWDVGTHLELTLGRFQLLEGGRINLVNRVRFSDKGVPPEWIRQWSDKATDTTPAVNTQFIREFQKWAPALLEVGGYAAQYMATFLPFLGALARGNTITTLAIRQAAPPVSGTATTLIGRIDDIAGHLEEVPGNYNVLNDPDWGEIMQERWEDDVIRSGSDVTQVGPGGYWTQREAKRFKWGGLKIVKVPRPH
jgi:hypothetical protein